MKKHLERKHPTIQMVPREETNTVVTFDIQNQFVASTSADQVPTNIAEPISTRRRIYPTITSFLPRRRTNIDKTEIDKRIMGLFIHDFHPFRTIEQRGFKELINFAFPEYTIPTRKYFANRMLPAEFEKRKIEIKDKIANEAKSISITVDIWTSSTSDSYMAITGHYIETVACNLESFLLDCIPLDGNHTAHNLSKEIKRICDEWQVTNKILIAITDNGKNIKNAIEKELGWKHFPCYAHTLNLVV